MMGRSLDSATLSTYKAISATSGSIGGSGLLPMAPIRSSSSTTAGSSANSISNALPTLPTAKTNQSLMTDSGAGTTVMATMDNNSHPFLSYASSRFSQLSSYGYPDIRRNDDDAANPDARAAAARAGFGTFTESGSVDLNSSPTSAVEQRLLDNGVTNDPTATFGGGGTAGSVGLNRKRDAHTIHLVYPGTGGSPIRSPTGLSRSHTLPVGCNLQLAGTSPTSSTNQHPVQANIPSFFADTSSSSVAAAAATAAAGMILPEFKVVLTTTSQVSQSPALRGSSSTQESSGMVAYVSQLKIV